MQAVLYHHGVPKRADLLTRENRAWVSELPLPAAGREQIAIALAVIDAIDLRLAPFDRELCRYARRQQGCKALMGHYGIGALTSVTILAELGDVSRFSSSRQWSATPAWTSPCTPPTSAARPDTSLAKARPPYAGRYMRPPRPPAASVPRTVTTSCKQPDGSGATAPASRSHASCSNAATTPSKTSARRDSRPHELPSCAHA